MFKRILIFVYGVASYARLLRHLPLRAGFVGNFVVPHTIDGVPRGAARPRRCSSISGCSALSRVQHSVMARPAFKRWLTRFVPEPAERSTYVLFSSLALIALFAFWQPLGGVVWEVESPVGAVCCTARSRFGWLLVLVSTFLINHFDLFGLRQVWLQLARPAVHASAVRHPRAVQAGASPAVSRLVLRVLGDADHDGDAPAVRDRDDRATS